MPPTLDFGAGPVPMPLGGQVLNLSSGAIPVPADGPVDWSQLDELPDCITLEWRGAERGVVEAVAAHPSIKVGTVRFSGPGLRSVKLPR
nr:hypothetical protein GCM10020063_090070 [Dactylosporangium thailandense]